MQKTCLKGTVRPPCWSVGVFYRNQVGLWLRPTFVVGSNLVCETSRLQVRDRQRPHRLFVRLFRDLVIIAFEVSNIPRYFWFVSFIILPSIPSMNQSKDRNSQEGGRISKIFDQILLSNCTIVLNSQKRMERCISFHFNSIRGQKKRSIDRGLEPT